MSVDSDYERRIMAMRIEYLHVCRRYGKCQGALGLIWNHGARMLWPGTMTEWAINILFNDLALREIRTLTAEMLHQSI